MHKELPFATRALMALSAVIPLSHAVPSHHYAATRSQDKSACRFLPGDLGWPSEDNWATFNNTIGGRLIKGVPLGQPCYGPHPDATVCTEVQETWDDLDPL